MRSARREPPFGPARTALVTGAASGIGWALTAALLERGTDVVALDRDEPALAELSTRLGAPGRAGRLHTAAVDVTDRAGLVAVVDDAWGRCGGIDLLINNAGIAVGGEIRDLEPDDWDRVMQVNVAGVVNGIDAVYPRMVDAGRGHIVNVASVAGLVPLPGEAPYVASKYAVVGLTRVLQAEARALGVGCTLVCPAKVETPIYATTPVRGVRREAVLDLWPTGVTPQRCAADILRGVATRRATVVITGSGKALVAAERFAPGLVRALGQRYLARVRAHRGEPGGDRSAPGPAQGAPEDPDALDSERDAALHQRLSAMFEARGRRYPGQRFEPVIVRNDGLRLHLDVLAAENARGTVVFAPGTNGYALLYAELLAALADAGWNVVGLDPRGHGRSDGVPGSWTVEELASDVGAAVAYAQERFRVPVAVAGSSLGGISAFYLAASARSGELLGAVCHNIADLADPASIRLTRVPPALGGVGRALTRWAAVVPNLRVPLGSYLRLADEPVEGVGTALAVIDADPLVCSSVTLRGLRSMSTAPLPVPIEEIATPVLVVHGGRDRIFPEAVVRRWARRLPPPSELLVIDDAHHYLIVDRVPDLIGPIVRWLDGRLAEVAGT